MKAPRGRPKLECRVTQVRVTLSLREGEDDDLLFFFTNIPNGRRAAMLKCALRTGQVHLGSASMPQEDDLDLTIEGLVYG